MGDIVSVDLGVKKGKYYIDNCWTVVVDKQNATSSEIRSNTLHSNKEVTRFLSSGVKALGQGISQFKVDGRTGDISAKMQQIIENDRYSVIKDFVGHGIGLKAHEDPQIPCYGVNGAGSVLKEGMVFAVEIMYAMGSPDHTTGIDGWSIVTADGKLSAMFEHTVALTKLGPEILTE